MNFIQVNILYLTSLTATQKRMNYISGTRLCESRVQLHGLSCVGSSRRQWERARKRGSKQQQRNTGAEIA